MVFAERTSRGRSETMAISESSKKTESKAAGFLAAIGAVLKRHYQASRL